MARETNKQLHSNVSSGHQNLQPNQQCKQTNTSTDSLRDRVMIILQTNKEIS